MNQLHIQQVEYEKQRTAINTIRIIVFQQEQGVSPELEFDGQDETAIHLLAYLEGKPVGTLRIRQIEQKIVKIERLAVLKEARGQGIGKELMLAGLDIAQKAFKTEKVIINAQEYVKRLYENLGFEQVGERFDEAGIPHVKMIKKFSD